MTPRVLIVDGDGAFGGLVQEAFRAAGFAAGLCATRARARAKIADELPSLVVLAAALADDEGGDFLTELRRSPLTSTVPVLRLVAAPGEAHGGLMGGAADEYLADPCAPAEVVGRAMELMRPQLAPRQIGEATARLLRRLEAKNDELEALNAELETFAYSVSHDLRQPLRAVDGFSKALLERHGPALDDEGHHFLERIRAGAQRMDNLVNGLLALSRISRQPLERQPVRLDELADTILSRFGETAGDRRLVSRVQPGLRAEGDARLLESVLENLLGNAWKFTAPLPQTEIEVATEQIDGEEVFFVRDNGVGFDMAYAGKLFGPFQRLHSDAEFEGLGIGLATVQRIVHRHEGRIWAESSPGEGSTFYFTLGKGPSRAGVAARPELPEHGGRVGRAQKDNSA